MSIKKEDLLKVVEELSLSDEVKLVDIPKLDLYMDQLLTLIEDNLKGLSRNPDDKIITKTMVNNYAKDGIIAPPVNKKYNRRHVILLVLIYYLKQVLSLNDIKVLFAPILNDLSREDDDVISLEDIYSTFLKIRKIEFKNFDQEFANKYKLIHDQTSKLSNESQDLAEIFLLIIILAAQAGAQKRLAEKLIDKYFQSEKS